MEATAVLSVEGVHAYYGLSHVLFGVSVGVGRGEVVCLLGRNGAGKTTTMRSIMGLIRPREGRVVFKGKDITGRPPHEAARLGIGYVPEDRRIFSALSVQENLEVARKNGQGDQWNFERVFDLFPPLAERRRQRGGSLSGGEQQMLTIGRSLMGNPELLLLDEPSEGLAPLVVETLLEAVLELKRRGLTMLIAEQNLGLMLEVADRGSILEKGETRFSGPMEELKARPDLWEAYLTV